MPSVADEQQPVPQQANSKPVSAFRQSVSSITSKNRWVSPFRQHQLEHQSNPNIKIGKSEKLKREEAEQAAAEASSNLNTTPAAKKQKSNTSEAINPSIDPKILEQKQAALQNQAETSTNKKIRNEDKLIDLGGGLKMSQAAIDKIARERLAKDLEDIDTKASAQAKLRDQRYQKKLELQALKEQNKTNSKFAKFKKKLDLEKKTIQTDHDRKVKEVEASIASLDKQISDFDKKTKEEIEQANKEAELATEKADAKLVNDKKTTSEEAANLEKENLQTIHDHQIEQKRSEITTRVLHAKQSEYELELELLELKLAQSQRELSKQTETNDEHTTIKEDLESKIAATKSAISENNEKISQAKANQLESARSLKSAESELEASKDSVELLKKQLAELKSGKSDRELRLQEAIAKRKAYDEEQEKLRLEAEEKARIAAEEKAKREEEERIRKAEEEERIRKEAEEKKRLEEEERQKKIEEEAKLAEEKKKKHELAVASFGDDLDARKTKLDTEIAGKKANGGNIDEIALLELERKHLNSWTYENQTAKDKDLGDSLIRTKKEQEVKNKLAEKEAKKKAIIAEKEAKKNAAIKAKEEKKREKEAKKRSSAVAVAAGAATGAALGSGANATDKTASGTKALASEATKAPTSPTSKSVEPKAASTGKTTGATTATGTSASAPVAKERAASPPAAKANKGDRKSRRSSLFGFFKKRNSDESISPVRGEKTKAAGPLGVPTTTDAVIGGDEAVTAGGTSELKSDKALKSASAVPGGAVAVEKPEADAKTGTTDKAATTTTEPDTKASTGLATGAAAGTAAAGAAALGSSGTTSDPVVGSSKDLETSKDATADAEQIQVSTVDKSTQVEPETAEKSTQLDDEVVPAVSGKANEDGVPSGEIETGAVAGGIAGPELASKETTGQIQDSNNFGGSDIENVTGREFTTSIIQGGENPILAVQAADPNISLEEITLEQAKREENVLAVVAGHDSTLQEIKRNQLYSAGQSSAPVSKDSDAAVFDSSKHADTTTAPTTAGLADGTTHDSDVPATQGLTTRDVDASNNSALQYANESQDPSHAYHDNHAAGIAAATGAAGAGYVIGHNAATDKAADTEIKDAEELSPQEASNIYDAHHGAGVLASTSAAGAGYAAGHTEGTNPPEQAQQAHPQAIPGSYPQSGNQQGSDPSHSGQGYPQQVQRQAAPQAGVSSQGKPQNAYNNTRDQIIGAATGLGAGGAGGYGAAQAIGRDNRASQTAPSQSQQKSQNIGAPVPQQGQSAETNTSSGIPSDVATGILAATGAAGAGYALGHKVGTEKPSTSEPKDSEHKFLSNYEEPNPKSSPYAVVGATRELNDVDSQPSTIPGTQIPVDSNVEAKYDDSFAHQAPSTTEKQPTGAAVSGLASDTSENPVEESQYPTGTYTEPGFVIIPKHQKFQAVGGDHLKPATESSIDQTQGTKELENKPSTGASAVTGAGLGAATGLGASKLSESKAPADTSKNSGVTKDEAPLNTGSYVEPPAVLIPKSQKFQVADTYKPEAEASSNSDALAAKDLKDSTEPKENTGIGAAVAATAAGALGGAAITGKSSAGSTEPERDLDQTTKQDILTDSSIAPKVVAASEPHNIPPVSHEQSALEPPHSTTTAAAGGVKTLDPFATGAPAEEYSEKYTTTSREGTPEPGFAGAAIAPTSAEGTPGKGKNAKKNKKKREAKKKKKATSTSPGRELESSPEPEDISFSNIDDVTSKDVSTEPAQDSSLGGIGGAVGGTLAGAAAAVGVSSATGTADKESTTTDVLPGTFPSTGDKSLDTGATASGSLPASDKNLTGSGSTTLASQSAPKSTATGPYEEASTVGIPESQKFSVEPSVSKESHKPEVSGEGVNSSSNPETTNKGLGSTLGGVGAGAGIGAAISSAATKLTGDNKQSQTGTYEPRETVDIPEDQKLKVQPGVSRETRANESSLKEPSSTSTGAIDATSAPESAEPKTSSGPGIVETAAIAATGAALTGAAVFESTKDKVVNTVSGEANEVQGLGATLKDSEAAENLAQHKDSNRVETVDTAYYSTLDPRNAGKRLSHNDSNEALERSEQPEIKSSGNTGLGIGAATAGAGAIGAGVASAVTGDKSKSTDNDIKAKDTAATPAATKVDASKTSESKPLASKSSTASASKPSATKPAAATSKPVAKESSKSEKPEKKFSFKKFFKSDKKGSKEVSPVSSSTATAAPVKKSTDKATTGTASTTKAATGATTGAAAAGAAAVTAAASAKPETKSGPTTTKDTKSSTPGVATGASAPTESTSKDVEPSTITSGVASKDVEPSTIAAGTSTTSKDTTTTKDIKPKAEGAASSTLGTKPSSNTTDSGKATTSGTAPAVIGGTKSSPSTTTQQGGQFSTKDSKPIDAANGKESSAAEQKKVDPSTTSTTKSSDVDPSTKEQITGYVGAGLAAAGLTGTAAAIAGDKSSSSDVDKSAVTTGATGKDSSIAASGEKSTGTSAGVLGSGAATESNTLGKEQTYDNDSLYSYREEYDYEEVTVGEDDDGLLTRVVKAAVDYTTTII